MSEEKGDKTEKPTPKKLKDARKKGQVVRSRDLAVAGVTGTVVVAFSWLGERLIRGLGDRLARELTNLGDAPLTSITPGDLAGIAATEIVTLISLVGPLALCTMTAGVAIQGIQGGWLVAPEALQFEFGRLNPVKGMKKFGLMRSGADTLKTSVAVIVVAWLGWTTVEAGMADGPRMMWLSPVGAAMVGWDLAQTMLWRVTWALALLALADYALQRYRIMSTLRMTKQEVRDEAKQADGSAETKARIRGIQRDMSRRRMIADVERATVVITNPTHYAIALEYRRGVTTVPVVLAKGRDHLAAAIRKRAVEHDIPIVENKPLAQALFSAVEVGDVIPGPLFAAVAEVLAQLIRLKQLTL